MTIRWCAYSVNMLLVLSACRDGADIAERAASSPDTVKQAEGAAQSFPVATLSCADGSERTIGSSAGPELIVVASPMDCVLKRDELTRIGEALQSGPAPSHAVIVSGVPADERMAAQRVFGRALDLPLCWDQHDRVTIALNIISGPTILLVRDGRVVWRADGGLQSSEQLRNAIERENAR